MKDTPQHIIDKQRQIIHSKTDEERAQMGAEMFNAIYYTIKERIQEQEPELTPKEVTAKIFLRFYQHEFSEKEKERIIASIKSE
jgi:hypothetical protein